MEVLKNFGVDWQLLVAQLLNFLIVFYILKKLLYKPVLSMLKKREEQVKEGIKQAEEGRRLLEDSQEKEKTTLKKAQESADKIVADAKTSSLDSAKQIEESAREQADKILLQAKEKIEQDTAEAEEKLSKEIGKIAMSVLENVLPNILSEKDQDEVLKKAASKLK